MTYERFEDLPVWKVAIQLGVTISAAEPFKGQSSLRDQLQRATVSVSNNVAEGFERGTINELLAFLYIARGSAGGVRSMLCLLEHLPNFANLKSQISNSKQVAENISRQLRGWADSLQNSEIRGQRYFNDKTRKEDQRKKEREEFLVEQHQFREELASLVAARQQLDTQV